MQGAAIRYGRDRHGQAGELLHPARKQRRQNKKQQKQQNTTTNGDVATTASAGDAETSADGGDAGGAAGDDDSGGEGAVDDLASIEDVLVDAEPWDELDGAGAATLGPLMDPLTAPHRAR